MSLPDIHIGYIIFDTFMFILFVCLKLVLSCCLIFTLLNGIFNTFMFWFFEKFKITLLCFVISTLVTRICLLWCFALLWTIKQDFILNMEAHKGHWSSVTFVIKKNTLNKSLKCQCIKVHVGNKNITWRLLRIKSRFVMLSKFKLDLARSYQHYQHHHVSQ